MEDQIDQHLTKRQRRELKKQEIDDQRNQRHRRKKMTTVIVICITVIVVGGLVYLATTASNGNNTNTDLSAAVSGNPVLGSETAKVTIVEFSDFSCPACAAAAPIVEEIAKTYPEQVRIVFNSYNIGHQWSEKSLEAGECAYNQGKFWEFHDIIFSHQSEWASASDPVEKFQSYATQAGISSEVMKSCLDSNQMRSEVSSDTALGRSNKVTATPTFFINGQKIEGTRSLGEFKTIIDAELSKNQ
jgi:protein-disulfide isomerase